MGLVAGQKEERKKEKVLRPLNSSSMMKRAFLIAAGIMLVYGAAPAGEGSGRLVQPADLEYRGAFRLPDGPEEIAWMWCGESMTYYPRGDPSGKGDRSIFWAWFKSR